MTLEEHVLFRALILGPAEPGGWGVSASIVIFTTRSQGERDHLDYLIVMNMLM